MYPKKYGEVPLNMKLIEETQAKLEGEVVSSKQTQAGFAVGVKVKSAVQYLFQESYIEPGTKVYIKFPEFQLLRK